MQFTELGENGSRIRDHINAPISPICYLLHFFWEAQECSCCFTLRQCNHHGVRVEGLPDFTLIPDLLS